MDEVTEERRKLRTFTKEKAASELCLQDATVVRLRGSVTPLRRDSVMGDSR
jgi:hypothetical protein